MKWISWSIIALGFLCANCIDNSTAGTVANAKSSAFVSAASSSSSLSSSTSSTLTNYLWTATQRDGLNSSGTQGDFEADKVVEFLRYVDRVQENIDNCTRGTGVRLPDGEYNTDRFRSQALQAVDRANFLTRIWRNSALKAVHESQEFFYVAVRSLLESDDILFAAGNCYDYKEFKDFEQFCPYAYRDTSEHIHVKDLSIEYKYLTNDSEWFFMAKAKAEELLQHYNKTEGTTTLRHNATSVAETAYDESIIINYENGHWSLPYFDCGGGNIWMMTYTVPFLGYKNNTYFFKGTSGIDIDLRDVDINQCPENNETVINSKTTQLMHKERRNVFAGSDKCPRDSTDCKFIPGLGFRRGSYMCVCKKGYYFPDIGVENRFYNGTEVEQEHDKYLLDKENTWKKIGCIPCGKGCEECSDGRPCVLTHDWTMRTSILIVQCTVISCTTVLLWFTVRFSAVKVVKAASPALLRIILLGSLILYSPILISYSEPSDITCAMIPWFNEVGFAIAYCNLLKLCYLLSYRISVVFRVRSAARIRITDRSLIKRLLFIVAVFVGYVTIWTIVDRPRVVNARTLSGLKTNQCSLTWWDHAAAGGEILLLLWGIRLSFIVRKAPSEFNESKFITWAIYNETLLSMFLNIALIFLQDPANPDLRYIILFVHSQLTTTVVLGLLFGSKMYLVYKYQGKGGKHDSCSSKRTLAVGRTCDKCHKSYIGECHVDAVKKLQPREPTMDRCDVEVSNQLQSITLSHVKSTTLPTCHDCIITILVPSKIVAPVFKKNVVLCISCVCYPPFPDIIVMILLYAITFFFPRLHFFLSPATLSGAHPSQSPKVKRDEFQRLYAQLERLKTLNMATGNPHLGETIAAMTDAALATTSYISAGEEVANIIREKSLQVRQENGLQTHTEEEWL
ncbi:metabotropic glycine receptor-like [Saccoglossus kowalevskii]